MGLDVEHTSSLGSETCSPHVPLLGLGWGCEGEEQGTQRRAVGAFAMVGTFPFRALHSEGSQPTPKISFCCREQCLGSGVEGGRARRWVLEHHGGDGCNDVLQEMPPHTCHAVLPPHSFCPKTWDQGECDRAAGAGRGW